jgi:hypothetical protein
MEKNVGSTDKTIRIVLGIGLAGVGVLAPVGLLGRIVLFVAAGIALVTAFTGF